MSKRISFEDFLLNEAKENQFVINGIKLDAKIIVSEKPDKSMGTNGSWTLELINKKENVSITAYDFFSYRTGSPRGSTKPDYHLHAKVFSGPGVNRGTEQRSPTKPNLNASIEQGFVNELIAGLIDRDKYVLDIVDIYDPENKLNLE